MAWRTLLIIGAVLTPLAAAVQGAPVQKKLIEFGWDIATPQYLRDHIQEMERIPFDGTILTTKVQHAGEEVTFEWQAWSNDAFAWEEFLPSLGALKATKTTTLRHNFVRFNTTPGDVDWFDDYDVIINNARLVARYAKQGGLEGICFDIEQYNSPLFHYPQQKYHETKSFDDYAFQCRKRGRQVMQVFKEEFPDVVILLMFGHCLPYVQSRDAGGLETAGYGLLAPFLDGLVVRCPPTAKIVDGYELAYPYKTKAQFVEGRRIMKELAPSVSKFPDVVKRVEQAGFGIWMDYNSGNLGWHPEDFSKNHFSLQEFEQSVRAALEVCDEYVWVYTERLNWWTQEKVPPEYIAALRAAQE